MWPVHHAPIHWFLHLLYRFTEVTEEESARNVRAFSSLTGITAMCVCTMASADKICPSTEKRTLVQMFMLNDYCKCTWILKIVKINDCYKTVHLSYAKYERRNQWCMHGQSYLDTKDLSHVLKVCCSQDIIGTCVCVCVCPQQKYMHAVCL